MDSDPGPARRTGRTLIRSRSTSLPPAGGVPPSPPHARPEGAGRARLSRALSPGGRFSPPRCHRSFPVMSAQKGGQRRRGPAPGFPDRSHLPMPFGGRRGRRGRRGPVDRPLSAPPPPCSGPAPGPLPQRKAADGRGARGWTPSHPEGDVASGSLGEPFPGTRHARPAGGQVSPDSLDREDQTERRVGHPHHRGPSSQQAILRLTPTGVGLSIRGLPAPTHRERPAQAADPDSPHLHAPAPAGRRAWRARRAGGCSEPPPLAELPGEDGQGRANTSTEPGWGLRIRDKRSAARAEQHPGSKVPKHT